MDLKEYQKLNQSFRNELIFHIGATSGFYSEFNNMVLAMAYCLQSRIKFTLYSEDANFKYNDGWNDFFLPFCKEVEGRFYHIYNLRDEDPNFVMGSFWKRLRYLLWKIGHKHTFLTHDLFFRFRLVSFARESFSIPELSIENVNLRTLARDIIDMIYCFNAETSGAISSTIVPLKLPKEYVGLHIRGGDKFVEHELEQCSAYISKAEQLSSLRDAFVLTDDYLVIQTLQRDYPNWTFYTLTNPSEKGYFHQDFLKLNAFEKKNKLIKLFSSMEVLRHSKLFIGTFSSNPGMFLGMCMEEAYGVDIDRWTVW